VISSLSEWAGRNKHKSSAHFSSDLWTSARVVRGHFALSDPIFSEALYFTQRVRNFWSR